MATPTRIPVLPTQVEPPAYSLSGAPFDHSDDASNDRAVVAVPVLAGEEDGSLVLGPGAADVAEDLGVDLFAVLEHHRASGKPGEVTTHPVLDHPRWSAVHLVGVGSGGNDDLRRAGAGLARVVKDQPLLVTRLPPSVTPTGSSPS